MEYFRHFFFNFSLVALHWIDCVNMNMSINSFQVRFLWFPNNMNRFPVLSIVRIRQWICRFVLNMYSCISVQNTNCENRLSCSKFAHKRTGFILIFSDNIVYLKKTKTFQFYWNGFFSRCNYAVVHVRSDRVCLMSEENCCSYVY